MNTPLKEFPAPPDELEVLAMTSEAMVIIADELRDIDYGLVADEDIPARIHGLARLAARSVQTVEDLNTTLAESDGGTT